MAQALKFGTDTLQPVLPNQMVHIRELLMHQRLGNANGAERADSPQVIANQIDNHDVLRIVLHAFTEGLADSIVLSRVWMPSSRALDWKGRNISAPIPPQKTFRRCR